MENVLERVDDGGRAVDVKYGFLERESWRLMEEIKKTKIRKRQLTVWINQSIVV